MEKFENIEIAEESQFIIRKSYDGYPSKDKTIFSGTLVDCQKELQSWISVSKRNGADIVSESDTHYTCENYDNNHATVTFEIREL